MTAKPTLLDLVLTADGKELEVIDKKIAEKQAIVDEAQGEVNKLKALRKTIDILVNGKPERKKREAKKKSAKFPPPSADVTNSAEDRRKRIALYLNEHGATRVHELAIQLKEEIANVNYSVSNGYFTKTERGVVMTPEGRNRYID